MWKRCEKKANRVSKKKLIKEGFIVSRYKKEEYLDLANCIINFRISNKNSEDNYTKNILLNKIFLERNTEILNNFLCYLIGNSINNQIICYENIVSKEMQNLLKIHNLIEKNNLCIINIGTKLKNHNYHAINLITKISNIFELRHKLPNFNLCYIPNIIIQIYDFFEFSLNNIYFSAELSNVIREKNYEFIYSNLKNFKNFVKNIPININNQLNSNIKTDFYCYISSKFEILKKESVLSNSSINSLNMEKYSDMENDTFLNDSKKEKIHLKNMKSKKKKDNLFHEKINKLKELIKILNLKNDGIILSPNEEFLKILYHIVYENEDTYKGKKIFTLVNIILDESDSSIKNEYLDYLNQRLKQQMFIEKNKIMELKWSYNILNLLLEIFNEILEINKVDIYKELFADLLIKILFILNGFSEIY